MLALLLVTLPFAATAEDGHFNAPRSADIDAAGLKYFRAKPGSSDRVIVSDAGLRRIEIRGPRAPPKRRA